MSFKSDLYEKLDDGQMEVYEGIVGDVNEGLVKFALDSLRAHGYRPKVTYDGDTYFIFTGCPHSVTHFTMPQTPGWLWGIWAKGEFVKDDGITVLSLFCQHKTQIDKFKPSASACCVNLSMGDLADVMNGDYKTRWVNEPWATRKMVALADFVRTHPFLAYCGECDDFMPMAYHPVLNTMSGVASHYRRELSKKVVRLMGRGFQAYASMFPFVEEARITEWAYPTSELQIRIEEGADPEMLMRVIPSNLELLGETFRCSINDGKVEWFYDYRQED